MYIFSGSANQGKCGTATHMKDCTGQELFVGDMVLIYKPEPNGSFVGDVTLTAVVEDKLFLGGEDKLKPHFVMGIRSCCEHEDFDGWIVKRVKRWSQAVNKESWESFGFNYQETA